MGREVSEWAFRDPWLRGHLLGRLQGPSRTESMTLSGTAPGWEPPEDPDTGSECSHPEVTPSPRFVAAKTQTNQSGKKAPASVVRCASLLHRTPPATQTQTFRTPNSGSPASKAAAGTDGLYYPHLPGCYDPSPTTDRGGGAKIFLPGQGCPEIVPFPPIKGYYMLKTFPESHLQGDLASVMSLTPRLHLMMVC